MAGTLGMSRFLAIDTVTEIGSVAIGNPDALMAEILIGNRRQAAALAPTIDHVLDVAGVTFSDLDGIVVADGPGSFTGLRIGFAAAKGILLAHDYLRLWTAPSLMALAFSFRDVVDGPVAALYDALRGDVFGAVYRFTGDSATVHLPPTLGTVTQLTELCSASPSLGVGSGAVAWADMVQAWTGRATIGPPVGVPRAASLLGLLTVAEATTVVEDPSSFEPTYGRLAEAEVRRREIEKGKSRKTGK